MLYHEISRKYCNLQEYRGRSRVAGPCAPGAGTGIGPSAAAGRRSRARPGGRPAGTATAPFPRVGRDAWRGAPGPAVRRSRCDSLNWSGHAGEARAERRMRLLDQSQTKDLWRGEHRPTSYTVSRSLVNGGRRSTLQRVWRDFRSASCVPLVTRNYSVKNPVNLLCTCDYRTKVDWRFQACTCVRLPRRIERSPWMRAYAGTDSEEANTR